MKYQAVCHDPIYNPKDYSVMLIPTMKLRMNAPQ
jgi:hypothetical protein